MVEINIGVREKAIRNLVVLFVIPFITSIWISEIVFIWWLLNNQPTWESWWVLNIALVVVSLLEFLAIVYIRIGEKSRE